MKTKVLKIFAVFFILNFYACDTSKDSGQVNSEQFVINEKSASRAYAEDEADFISEDIIPDEDTPNLNTEEYDKIRENEFLSAKSNPLSTFSIDVDNASYSNVRRMLNYGQMPDKGAVRIEEMINYFSYDYENPTGKDPFSIYTETGECPWNANHKLLHIGIQGKKT